MPEIDLSNWPNRERNFLRQRVPYGYKPIEEGSLYLVPDIPVVEAIEEALDGIDKGASLREASAWLTEKTGKKISHQGVNVIWKRLRAVDPKNAREKKQKAIRRKNAPKTGPDKAKAKIKRKLADTKRVETLTRKKLANWEDRSKPAAPEPPEPIESAPIISPEPESLPVSVAAPESPTENVIFRPNDGPQTEFLASSEREVLYGGAAGGGKLTRVDQPILTFNRGWQTMGSLVVGDYVFGSNGEPTRVIWKSESEIPQVAYQVTFNTGESFEVDARHQWLTLTQKERDYNFRRTPAFRERRKANRASRAVENSKKPWVSKSVTKVNQERVHEYLEPIPPQPRTAQEIRDTLIVGSANKKNHSVAVVKPLWTGSARDLPIEPYLFGLFLGDGCSTHGYIGMLELDWGVIEGLQTDLRALLPRHPANPKRVLKCIPDQYQFASVEDRLALLQGLMDTDGTVAKHNGACEIALSDPELARDVHTLISSLGIKSTFREKKIKGYRSSWRMAFHTTMPVFRLPRKLELQNRTPKPEYTERRYIVSVEPVEPRLMQCIQVDNSDHSYCLGNTFIVTHNSFALLADPMRYFGNRNFNGLILRRTNDELRELIWKSHDLYTKAYPGAVWKEKKSSWEFPSGAQLWMTYLERDQDVLRYQGQAFSYIGWDELTQHPTPFAYNYMRSRLRTTDPELPTFIRATTNPGGPGMGWVKRMFVDPAPANQRFVATDLETGEEMRQPEVYSASHPKAGQPNPDGGKPLFYRRFIPATLYDNPYLTLDGSYESNLLSLPESQRRQLLEGDWSIADGAAFPEFRPHIHICSPFDVPDNWRRFRSCDYGYSSFSAVHWFAIDPAFETLFVYRELYLSKHTGRDLAKAVLEAERGEKIDYGVLDSSCWHQRGQTGPSIAEEMISMGCRWRPSDRTHGARVNGKNRFHEVLKVDPETERPGIVFFNNCRQIIADLPIIPSDPKGTDDIDPRYATDHAYDSVRYGIMSRPRAFSPFAFTNNSPSRWKPADATLGY